MNRVGHVFQLFYIRDEYYRHEAATVKSSFLPATAIALAALCNAPAAAQTWPARPIRMIVPANPGGATDIVARTLAPKLGEALGQPVLIDNRGGAGGTIGTEAVAKAAPDGYTLLAIFDNFTTNPYLFKDLAYDPLKDFTPISLLVKSALVVVVGPRLGVTRFEDFVRIAKDRNSALNYASAGPGSSSRLAVELLKQAAGINPTAIHYKGGSPAMAALLGAQVDMMLVTIGVGLPYVKAGKLTALAVTSAGRSSLLPELPALSELYPGFEVQSWVGVLGPAGMPREIVARLNAEILGALATDVKQRLQSQGYEVTGSTPEAFGEWLRVDSARWGRVIREQRITLD
jgi:tripartite-type tricarboxylate transporter receptor subunit TctC